ncbi:hypothetical protein niasHT_031344 [Heterodera trifolii]|uniref:Fido domain-containing protein n=1 Tax=Heterodera trifolii TaxID=157864 RepID=A0ABD2ISU7_9BILA
MFLHDRDLLKRMQNTTALFENKNSLTEEDIQKLNALAMNSAIGAGVYRTRLVQVGDYVAIPHEKVPAAMKELIKQINQPTDAEGFKKMAITAHLELYHPILLESKDELKYLGCINAYTLETEDNDFIKSDARMQQFLGDIIRSANELPFSS